jgi:hypothetical protein
MKNCLVAVMLILFAWIARADMYSFYAITSNDPSGYAQLVGENQLSMDVSLLGMGQVRLIFSNEGSSDAVVHRIYFDYMPELNLGLVAINDGNGVEFTTARVKPSNLPAGNSLENDFVSDLGFASLNPSPHRGINPGESLELILSYNDNVDFMGALGNEDLRVGVHVISLGEYSESFVNVVPEPATLPMILVGSTLLRWFRIRKSRKGKSGDSFVPLLDKGDRDQLQWVEVKGQRVNRGLARNRLEAAFVRATTCSGRL